MSEKNLTYQFWDTEWGTLKIDPALKTPKTLTATPSELISHVITDVSPNPGRRGWKSSAEDIALGRLFGKFLIRGLCENNSKDWTLVRNPNLAKNYRRQFSENLSIAFSRHSASVSKGYHYCVQIDHFLKGGAFYSPNLKIEKRFPLCNRPDYLMATTGFFDETSGVHVKDVCGSMEVKGRARSVLAQVPPLFIKQSRNILLKYSHSPKNLHQNLLSMVRVNTKDSDAVNREIVVRHSNYFWFWFHFDPNLFRAIVLAHYLRIWGRFIIKDDIGVLAEIYRRIILGGVYAPSAATLEEIDKSRANSYDVRNIDHVFVSKRLKKFLLDVIFRGDTLLRISSEEFREELDEIAMESREMNIQLEREDETSFFYRADGFGFLAQST